MPFSKLPANSFPNIAHLLSTLQTTTPLVCKFCTTRIAFQSSYRKSEPPCLFPFCLPDDEQMKLYSFIGYFGVYCGLPIQQFVQGFQISRDTGNLPAHVFFAPANIG